MKSIKEIGISFIVTFTIVFALYAISSFANAKADTSSEVVKGGEGICLYFDVWSDHPVSREILIATYELSGYTYQESKKIISDSTIIYCPRWYQEV